MPGPSPVFQVTAVRSAATPSQAATAGPSGSGGSGGGGRGSGASSRKRHTNASARLTRCMALLPSVQLQKGWFDDKASGAERRASSVFGADIDLDARHFGKKSPPIGREASAQGELDPDAVMVRKNGLDRHAIVPRDDRGIDVQLPDLGRNSFRTSGRIAQERVVDERAAAGIAVEVVVAAGAAERRRDVGGGAREAQPDRLLP